jgi:hypothetical protein
MSMPANNISSCTLLDAHFAEYPETAILCLETTPNIRNRKRRKVTCIGYDQTIAFVNRAVVKALLICGGRASGTHYLLTKKMRNG